ncbi:peptidoglycan bridge formation glycyltransferase FemA/FemB family protein [Streptomyces caniscabiei]|uniref:lipid II:glycine glycyltransferase FemX n=1 Tax=Streptomyces caniscabiei TaxID=2746961 RepID=UPI0029A7653F|nr:peptidoglycan bridge formation glycyltransferase FemA/FemB family protein [Streptomyces caniscabiei]MDX2776365.1 peptidoglycan bridge formation glycyltransferase FemA/FemB family protein [Streptomyces caniscabiei]
MIRVEQCENKQEWDGEILAREGHPLQLWGWGAVKEAHNWDVRRLFVIDEEERIGAAQVLIRRLPAPLTCMAYIPRGPVAKEPEKATVLEALAEYAKTSLHAVVLTVEPDWEGMPRLEKWKHSTNTILIPRTLILDLGKTEDELMADMAKKTRQYIRKSAKEAIEVRQVKGREELDACLAIYKETARRAGFALHGDDYYYDVFEKLGEHSPVFAVFEAGEPVAFLWLAISSFTAFELYGGMNDRGQELRANYALKWHAIQTMKKWGLVRYDFNGLLNDGVSTFKQGFASHEDMLAGTYDRPLSPLYVLWSKGLPLAKKAMRAVNRR